MQINLTKNPKQKITGDLPFGRNFTDHMLTIDYSPEDKWHNAKIIPYAPLEMDPATSCLHYGQLFFEGLKAYRRPDGSIAMFRPMENMLRFNNSARRMSMPEIDPDILLDALIKLMDIEKDWVPDIKESSLYIRPFMYATDPFIGLRPSNTYKIVIILSPVGAYYGKDGLAPIKIMVEDEYVRAVRGGTGYAKCAGNYAGSLLSQMLAAQNGYNQVMWLDAIHRKYIEEVGAMNVFFVIDKTVITPELSGSILPGITRKSIIEILKDWGYSLEERPISIQEVADSYDNNTLKEVFGSGTAAVVSPVGELKWGEKIMLISENVGELTQKIYNELTNIQYGVIEDTRGWVKIL